MHTKERMALFPFPTNDIVSDCNSLVNMVTYYLYLIALLVLLISTY